jgi:hypothetical protein
MLPGKQIKHYSMSIAFSQGTHVLLRLAISHRQYEPVVTSRTFSWRQCDASCHSTSPKLSSWTGCSCFKFYVRIWHFPLLGNSYLRLDCNDQATLSNTPLGAICQLSHKVSLSITFTRDSLVYHVIIYCRQCCKMYMQAIWMRPRPTQSTADGFHQLPTPYLSRVFFWFVLMLTLGWR